MQDSDPNQIIRDPRHASRYRVPEHIFNSVHVQILNVERLRLTFPHVVVEHGVENRRPETHIQKFSGPRLVPVLYTSVVDPDPGSGAFLTPGSRIRDPE